WGRSLWSAVRCARSAGSLVVDGRHLRRGASLLDSAKHEITAILLAAFALRRRGLSRLVRRILDHLLALALAEARRPMRALEGAVGPAEIGPELRPWGARVGGDVLVRHAERKYVHGQIALAAADSRLRQPVDFSDDLVRHGEAADGRAASVHQ